MTIHVGEEGGRHGIEEIGEVVEHLRPDRIGHGILAAKDEETMRALRETEIVLEICPSSNLLTGALADEDELRETVRTFADRGVAFTIATDGPEMMQTHLRDELALLSRIGALEPDEVERRQRARPRGGVRTPKGVAARSPAEPIAGRAGSLPRSPPCSASTAASGSQSDSARSSA